MRVERVAALTMEVVGAVKMGDVINGLWERVYVLLMVEVDNVNTMGVRRVLNGKDYVLPMEGESVANIMDAIKWVKERNHYVLLMEVAIAVRYKGVMQQLVEDPIVLLMVEENDVIYHNAKTRQ